MWRTILPHDCVACFSHILMHLRSYPTIKNLKVLLELPCPQTAKIKVFLNEIHSMCLINLGILHGREFKLAIVHCCGS